MTPRRFSLIAAGAMWLLVAARIANRGWHWLQPYFHPPQWQLSFLILSLIIGALKARTVLRKASERNIGNLDRVDNKNPLHYLFGWLIIYGKRGTAMIAIMIGLGLGLRHLREIGYDSSNVFGFIYMGIAIGLGLSSLYYFEAAAKHK